jgi:hypothetical protein
MLPPWQVASSTAVDGDEAGAEVVAAADGKHDKMHNPNYAQPADAPCEVFKNLKVSLSQALH